VGDPGEAPRDVHDLVPGEAVSERLVGIAVHSAQSVFIGILVLTLVV
jgi:hypothetical protein